ncbi:IS1182 family transposase [Roseimicrobium sp. ORNL1]|uniref:IS1182 family transposase n=1 Tax=Roseimicrobium sp. ORNL1 TaxID=2711231 RepID=UPI0013E1663C|nr:IS1182 family transposase [Roseimicrobium sp. ORNL1]QIF04998.1 IS1182 family transposase [Roseimicrobium sp. ORNL1]
MSYVQGVPREEVQLLPPSVEEYVDEQAPVRFIEVFVNGLDMVALKFTHAVPSATGRPSYDPKDLLKLYLYGYLHRIRSSRRLEAEAGRNLELLWLLRLLKPDFKTIADFRRDNRSVFKGVLRQFNLLCRQLGLFGAELVAIDGSKFKALNNSQRHGGVEQLRKLIAHVDARIEEYLRALDSQDEQVEGAAPRREPAGVKLTDKLAELSKHREQYACLLAQLEQEGGARDKIAFTDVEARKVKDVQRSGYMMGYNVQAAVDTRHDLIVAEDVVAQANDRSQLAPMALAAQEALQARTLEVVADKGYHQAAHLQQCEQAGVVTYVPAQGTNSGQSTKDGREVFAKEQFGYEAGADVYHCPGAQVLRLRGRSSHEGRTTLLYSNESACRKCALRGQCTAGRYRTINRSPHEEAVERAARRLAERPHMMHLRRRSVEHVFGTLRMWGHDSFLTRGLHSVRAEFSLSALAYNLRRVLNLLPLQQLIHAARKSA